MRLTLIQLKSFSKYNSMNVASMLLNADSFFHNVFFSMFFSLSTTVNKHNTNLKENMCIIVCSTDAAAADGFFILANLWNYKAELESIFSDFQLIFLARISTRILLMMFTIPWHCRCLLRTLNRDALQTKNYY